MTDITIPDEVVEAMKQHLGRTFAEMGLDYVGMIRAGLAAWPGMKPMQIKNYKKPDGVIEFGVSTIIALPLPQEKEP